MKIKQVKQMTSFFLEDCNLRGERVVHRLEMADGSITWIGSHSREVFATPTLEQLEEQYQQDIKATEELIDLAFAEKDTKELYGEDIEIEYVIRILINQKNVDEFDKFLESNPEIEIIRNDPNNELGHVIDLGSNNNELLVKISEINNKDKE